jgi:serine/threonine protein kinase
LILINSFPQDIPLHQGQSVLITVQQIFLAKIHLIMTQLQLQFLMESIPQIPNYNVTKQLIRTPNTVVYHGHSIQTGQEVAIKISVTNLEPEVEILSGIEHPAILRPIELITFDNGISALILPYAQGGDLFDVVSKKPLCEETAKIVLFRIAHALQELHKHSIWHQDVKLENIVLMESDLPETAMLIDFGLSKHFQDGICYEPGPGTRHYVAPEILLGLPYTEKIDVWS